MSIPATATHGIDFVVWDLESLTQKHNVNTNQCGDQKIARFRDHPIEYRLGTHSGQTINKIFKSFRIWLLVRNDLKDFVNCLPNVST